MRNKFFNWLTAAAVMFCVLAGSAAASGGCDCSKFPNLPPQLQGWCDEVKINGTLVDYNYYEENDTALLVCDEWVPYNETKDAYFPAIKTEKTPHAVTTTDKYDFTIELIDVTEETFASEECAKLQPGEAAECEKIVKAKAEESVAFKNDTYQSPTEVEESTNCYVEENKTKIEVEQDVTGHAMKLVRFYYLVTFNHSNEVKDKVGNKTTEIDVLGNPCPNDCDKAQSGCIPCAA